MKAKILNFKKATKLESNPSMMVSQRTDVSHIIVSGLKVTSEEQLLDHSTSTPNNATDKKHMHTGELRSRDNPMP